LQLGKTATILPPLLFCAHMIPSSLRRESAPCSTRTETIHSAGDTVLGADESLRHNRDFWKRFEHQGIPQAA
jgi:hypothetical protein